MYKLYIFLSIFTIVKPILEIENLSKVFRIYDSQQPYLSIRDSVKNIFSKAKTSEFYALHDVSFCVNEGDSLGIIGKNGAGKSTLLKILSKITPPSHGQIVSRGRIASLLEVGTGFHAELTGRENVYMNGSILGMKRSEIQKNFDAIVDFAGVEKFIDTPLKHYSSGMQLRLAFAVAAFLENEILIIDEVLAVGDAEFQKKCIGKMGEVSKSGRTVLFVSHDMGVVSTLCNRGIVLSKGEKLFDGKSSEAILKYNTHETLEFDKKQVSPGIFILKEDENVKGSILGKIMVNGIPGIDVNTGDDLEIQVEVNNPDYFNDILFGFQINNELNTAIIGIHNRNTGYRLINQKFQKGTIAIKIPKNSFYGEGRYTIDIWLGDYNEPFEMLTGAMSFNMIKTDIYKSSYLLEFTNNKLASSSIELYGVVNS